MTTISDVITIVELGICGTNCTNSSRIHVGHSKMGQAYIVWAYYYASEGDTAAATSLNLRSPAVKFSEFIRFQKPAITIRVLPAVAWARPRLVLNTPRTYYKCKRFLFPVFPFLRLRKIIKISSKGEMACLALVRRSFLE
jgi:hypothetical protein